MKNNKKTYALFGNPVEHSLSPVMHKAALKEMKVDARYIAIRVENAREITRKIKEMNVQGASITIPHKTAVMDCLDEVSESSGMIGAVNTLTFTDGKLKGDNTDWTGFTCALKETIEIEGKTFAVLGAGGAARAAIFGILQEGGTPIILNRTVAKGEKLAKEFGCDFHPISEVEKIKADCLINSTPAGMFPDMEISPVRAEALSNFGCVMDMIYNPLETRLLKDAQEAGCSVISGLPMFIYQGAEQIRIWTGFRPPLDLMKQVVLEKLTNE
jgi:shikimate dehydrogenase